MKERVIDVLPYVSAAASQAIAERGTNHGLEYLDLVDAGNIALAFLNECDTEDQIREYDFKYLARNAIRLAIKRRAEGILA